jgi:hypothetical protein
MDSFILAGVSLLILLPIVYFLPLGFTVKGKVFIVVASLLIGLFGLVSAAVFPLWQTALILLVFVGSLAYLMSKRDLVWLYLPEENDDPFSVEEDLDASPLKEIKESYTHIASSEKAPKGSLVEDHNESGVKQNSISVSLLDKLVTQHQQSVSTISNVKGEEADLEIHELQPKPVLVEEARATDDEVEMEELEPFTVTSDVNLEIEDLEPIPVPKEVDLEEVHSEIEALVHSGEEELTDPDIEALVHKTEELAEKMESSSTQAEDSSSYLSDLEKMIESEGQDQISSNDDSLEIITDFKTKPSVETEEPKFWLDDEFELEELTLNDSTSREKTVPEVKQRENEQENLFDLEELVLGEPDSLQNKDIEKKKILEQAVEDNKMVKQ